MRKAPTIKDIESEIEQTLRDTRQARSGLRQVLRRCSSPEERMMMGSWILLLNHHLIFLESVERDNLPSFGKRHRSAIWSMIQIIQVSVDTVINTWL